LRSGCSFSGRDPIYLPEVMAKNQQRPKRHHSERFMKPGCSRESAGIFLTLLLR
jgi:hypothetical protein